MFFLTLIVLCFLQRFRLFRRNVVVAVGFELLELWVFVEVDLLRARQIAVS